ncbi:CLUMA_CG014169, isoform A [Clunio marinus]|uniref:Synaptic plasticity regulator PANTS n=1 Tax=Clunio marinus TaxID=568069 RepID=A0A1J1ISM5_9DIPT|nr:CLUMA_CG014169, isoform A [Clunio marinus]
MMQGDSDLILEKEVSNNRWSIRPCQLYKEEYKDCKSIKGRFHQYFVHGDSLDCSSWEHDFENCLKYEKNDDLKAAKNVIDSEASRRKERMKAHYENNIWTKRANPPEDWAKPLPDHLNQQYENSFLDLKSKEMRGIPISPEAATNSSLQSASFCTIM